MYSKNQRLWCISIYESCKRKKKPAVEIINKKVGFEKVTRKMLRDWLEPHDHQKPGRKPNLEFEKCVLSNVMFVVLDGTIEKKKIVLANVAYGSECIRAAAVLAQKEEAFKDNLKVQALKFSDKWVQKFLMRNSLRRRRITATDKTRPDTAAVRATMEAIQSVIEKGIPGGAAPFPPECIINIDETGVNHAASMSHQIVPADSARAYRPDGDAKARFTAVLGATAAGKMLPVTFIVKCAVKSADMRSARVLNNILGAPGFLVEDGWLAGTWQKLNLTLFKLSYARSPRT